MNSHVTRRTFVAGLGAVGAVAALPVRGEEPRIRFGYAAITWGDDARGAMDDIAAAGYRGVQFRANVVRDFKAAELKGLMAERKLTFVALSSGEVSVDAPAGEQIAKHVANAQFVKDAGGLYLQMLDQGKNYRRNGSPEDCRKLGKLLTEIGKRTADIGVPLSYHNHLTSLSESSGNLDLIMESSDPKFVKLELDTAHILAGGGDPVKAIERYHGRLLFMHLKDVIDIPETPKTRYPFKFVELGRGRVDLPGVFAALKKVGFKGWAVVELDHTTAPEVSAKESAVISKKYLEQKIGIKV